MINIKIKEKNIIISGHANYDSKGYDIVCASVSTAVLMSINQIELFKKIDNLKYEIKDDGYVSIKVLSDDYLVNTVIDNLIFTLKDLQLQYPKNIKIEENL